MVGVRYHNIRLRHPARGVLRLEVLRARRLRMAAWGIVICMALLGALVFSKVFLLLPLLGLLFEGNPCIEVSRHQLTHGTSFWGYFLPDETIPLRAIKDVRVQDLRYRQWGFYRGPEDDRNAEGRGRNLREPYLVLDEGVAEIKLPLGLSDDEYEWLADYLESYSHA